MKKLIPSDANLIPPEAECVFRGEIFDVYQWQQEMFDGHYTTYENLRRADTVITIGIVDNKVVVIKDSQPHKGTTIGFPGGRVDEIDSSILAAAQREMREETGYEFASWRLVEVIKPLAKMEYFIYIYLAIDLVKENDRIMDAGGEKIELQLCDYPEALDRMRGLYHSAIEYIFLENIGSLENLLGMPEFTGIEVDIPVKR